MTTFADARTVTDTVVTTGSAGSVTAVDVNGAINAAIDAAEDELAAVVATKGAANGIASLDSGGKVPAAQLPAIAITDVDTVASEVEMLALSAERGDVAIRSDLNKSFVLSTDSPTTLADWKELLTPTDAVLSVAGKTGAVTLVANDISDAGTAGKAVLAGATAAAIRASGILNIDSVRNNIGDAAATLAATDRVAVTTAALTTARAWTLPAANAVNAGQSLLILDLFGGVDATNKITVTRAGSDTINGATTFDVSAAYGGVILISDGSSKWSAQAVGTQVSGSIKFVQAVEASYPTHNTSITAAIPIDDSIPQNTEGTEFLTRAITPKATTNKLVIRVVVSFYGSTAIAGVVALFQDSTANALAVGITNVSGSSVAGNIVFEHVMDAGTTSSTTFKLRIGTSTGTLYLNGTGATRLFGGILKTSMTITEYVP